ncbi:hypothetical protein KIL84_008474 [Mauremys mutica]|uniref:Uncharacterized protein n=1 Tax=Mauremys mutica TaxID=74926 RepID=A0A9D3X7S5_9SAUR|nr:hypothetical protein KIL84_008474 [Mauremys mutica]
MGKRELHAHPRRRKGVIMQLEKHPGKKNLKCTSFWRRPYTVIKRLSNLSLLIQKARAGLFIVLLQQFPVAHSGKVVLMEELQACAQNLSSLQPSTVCLSTTDRPDLEDGNPALTDFLDPTSNDDSMTDYGTQAGRATQKPVWVADCMDS